MSATKLDAVKEKNDLLAIISRVLKGKSGANLTLVFTLIIMLIIFSSLSPYFFGFSPDLSPLSGGGTHSFFYGCGIIFPKRWQL